MKTFTTLVKTVLIVFITFTALICKADDSTNINNLNFSSVPTMLNGPALQVGAKYKFNNVRPGTNAIITIVSMTNGATLEILDDNSLTKPEAFSPQIKIPANSNGMVEFRIEFVVGAQNNPKTLSTVVATAMDIDGTLNEYHEMDVLNMGAGSVLSYLSNTLEINVVQNGSDFTGTNIAGNEYPGVDTSAKQVMFTLAKNNISSFTYKVGVNNMDNESITRQKGIYFKGFDYGVLPVRYTNFSASAYDKGIMLSWATEFERESSHFEVERSFDRNNFTVIGMVLDAENVVNNTKTYRFKDNSSAIKDKEIVYYRLAQIDKNGKVTYSATVAVRMQSKAGVELQVSPNPFAEKIDIRVNTTTNQIANIKIINTVGQTVINNQQPLTKGYNTIPVTNLTQLKPGIYVVNVLVNNSVVGSQKIIKQ